MLPHQTPATHTAVPHPAQSAPPRLHRPFARARRRLATLLGLLTLVVTAGALVVPASADGGAPGNFRGWGFDQCETPSQTAMNRWLYYSPFQAVGIYISGASRACRSQPNLTSTWVRTQLNNGWRLLPITLGPQASCNPNFPRYGDDVRISASSGDNYARARNQGAHEAAAAVAKARSLGIPAGSTLWYDLEAFNNTNTGCRESALAFLHGWTRQLHAQHFVSGAYSSAASGIRALDDARASSTHRWTLPDRIWVADWDGHANTASSYIRRDGWQPGGRMKQYQGGHDEKWGGVRINIDRDYLQLGSSYAAAHEPSHCHGTRINFQTYRVIRRGSKVIRQVRALKCLLHGRGYYKGHIGPRYNRRLRTAIRRFQAAHHVSRRSSFSRSNWVVLLSAGRRVTMKYGSTDIAVRRLQRALNAAGAGHLSTTGVYDRATYRAVRVYQRRARIAATGYATPTTWGRLLRGAI